MDPDPEIPDDAQILPFECTVQKIANIPVLLQKIIIIEVSSCILHRNVYPPPLLRTNFVPPFLLEFTSARS